MKPSTVVRPPAAGRYRARTLVSTDPESNKFRRETFQVVDTKGMVVSQSVIPGGSYSDFTVVADCPDRRIADKIAGALNHLEWKESL